MENARRIAVLAFSLAALPAGAGTLYKSVGPNGVIQFSDIPPSDNSMVVETRPMSSNATNVPHSLEADESIVRANAQVDLAEHALALARRSMGSELEGLRLTTHRATASDVERVEFYKRGVILARQNLLEVLRARATPTVMASR